MADEEDEAAMARTDEAEALTVLPADSDADQGLEQAPEEVEEEAQLQSLEAAQAEDCEDQAEVEQGPDSEAEAEASQAILLQSVGVTYGDGTEVSEVDGPADFATGMVEGLSELERLALEAQGTNTIIYVQPDGTLVEGEGLTPEEQQQIVEQLTKQQGLVEIVDGDAAARLFEEHQQHQLQLQQQQQEDDQQEAEEQFVHHVGLGPEELQQVIEHVTKSQAAAAAAAAAAQNSQLENKSELASVTVQAADVTSGQPHIIHIPMGQLQGAGQTFQLVSHPQRVSTSKDVSPVSSTIFGQPITIVANATQHVQNAAQVILQQNQKLDAEVTTAVSPPSPLAVKGGDAVTLCVKSPGEKDRSMQTITTVAPKTIAQVQTLGLTGQVPSGSQIIQLQPVGQGQPQQFILCGAGGSPTTIRVVSQRQAQSLGSVSTVRLVSGVNGQRTARDSSIEGKEARAKKALKIKTRSGRISRPPLHKIKDYKFIKMEDLADGHQSDSDDYSEYSVEEEEESSGKEDKLGGTGHLSYTSKPKNFRCQNCDKSYIGRGGLARHYRLNPTHGALEALPEEVANGAGGSAEGSAEVTESLESLEPPVDEVIKVSAPVSTESQDPEVIVTSTFASCDKPRGFQKARRVGRPAKNTFHEQKRRARMKELLKQCDDDDLVELVFPRLIQVFSLWEILLMKVEYAGGSGLQFPAVYREFESLHGHVRTLAAEHLRSPAATQEPLQVNNPQVAETLGMLSGLVGEPNYDRTAPCKLVFVTASSQNAQKRALEAANKGTSGEPPRKRLRTDSAPCPSTGKPVAPSTSSASQTPCSPLPGVAASSSVTEAAGPSSPDVQLVSESSSQLISESTARLQGGTSVDCENIQLQVSPHMVSIGRQSPDVFVIEPETTSGSAQAADENTVNGAWAGCIENEAEAKTAEGEVVNGSATAPESTLDPENSHIEVPGFGDDTLIQGAEGIDGPSSGETSMIEPSNPPDSGVPDCADSVDHTAMDIQTPSFGDEALADDVATRCLDLSSEAPQEDGEGGDGDQSQIQEPIILAEVPKQLGAIGDSVTVANGAAISEGLTVHTHHRVLLQTRDGLLIPHPNPEEFVSGHGGADVVIVAEGGVGGAHGVPLETVQALLSMEASLGGTGSGQ